MDQPVSQSYEIVSPDLTVKAMRDSGYKSTAYALAELIDNSIDADADEVEVFACETPTDIGTQVRPRIDTIAVLDNGKGMDAELLRRALRFGDGQARRQRRIGRFGIGLPNSSLSQCQKVEVWSWTQGPGNALYTYLDLEEIKGGCREVPKPVHNPLPDSWRQLSQIVAETGTLVVWTQLDRVQWYGAAATLRNTEELIGRVYRHCIARGEVNIRLVPVREGQILDGVRDTKPNDPLYLMERTQTPAPFDEIPMFEPYNLGDPDRPGEFQYQISIDGQTYPVTVRASIAKSESRRWDIDGKPWPDDARPSVEPGHQKWGKHAGKNIGISIVREGRELDLDSNWAIGYDPIERWWGVEIEFTSDLDGVFGVTNNKQNATVFSRLAHFDEETEREEGETFKQLKDRMIEEGQPGLPLLEFAEYLKGRVIKPMRRRLRQQRAGSRSGGKRHDSDVTKQATDVVKRRQEEGHTGLTDALAEQTPPDERRTNEIKALVERHHVEQDEATSLVDEAVEMDWRVRWLSSYSDTPAFFSIDFLAAMLQVSFNMNHPVYAELMEVIEDVPDDVDEAELRRRLKKAARTFKLILFSWARYEDELRGSAKQRAAEARQDWGRYARDFLDTESEDS